MGLSKMIKKALIVCGVSTIALAPNAMAHGLANLHISNYDSKNLFGVGAGYNYKGFVPNFNMDFGSNNKEEPRGAYSAGIDYFIGGVEDDGHFCISVGAGMEYIRGRFDDDKVFYSRIGLDFGGLFMEFEELGKNSQGLDNVSRFGYRFLINKCDKDSIRCGKVDRK